MSADDLAAAYADVVGDHAGIPTDTGNVVCRCNGVEYERDQHNAHVAAALVASPAAKAQEAAVWDEAVEAVAWALDSGLPMDALPYVVGHNPYRAAATEGTAP